MRILKLNLLFFDEGADVPKKMQNAFAGHAHLNALQLAPNKIPTNKDLDALYLSLTAAERWGPRLIFYESQVLKTNSKDHEWPAYVIAGIALKPDDVRAGDPVAELSLSIRAVLQAADSYNQQNGYPIKNIGFWTETLGMRLMDAEDAGRIIRSVYDTLQGG